MSMDLQQVINSPYAVRFLAWLARGIPPHLGYALSHRIGDWIADHHEAKITQAVRLNQWVIRGGILGKEALDRAVHETLRNNARDIYNLYHYLQRPQVVQHVTHWGLPARRVVERPEFSERGLVILGIHLSNFDLILRTVVSQTQFKAMILTIPDPQGGRRVEYDMRKQLGLNLVPASVGALRQAVKHLEKGGMVVTGLDRPIPNPRQQPLFFGKPSALPTHYIYLAIKARVPIVVMAAQEIDREYHVFCSEYLEMEHHPNHQTEVTRNIERVLKQAERFICLAPQQWNMPLPVWPHIQTGV